jgi:hypothetical protein
MKTVGLRNIWGEEDKALSDTAVARAWADVERMSILRGFRKPQGDLFGGPPT